MFSGTLALSFCLCLCSKKFNQETVSAVAEGFIKHTHAYRWSVPAHTPYCYSSMDSVPVTWLKTRGSTTGGSGQGYKDAICSVCLPPSPNCSADMGNYMAMTKRPTAGKVCIKRGNVKTLKRAIFPFFRPVTACLLTHSHMYPTH